MTDNWHEPNTTVTSLSTLTYRQFASIPLGGKSPNQSMNRFRFNRQILINFPTVK